MTNYVEDMRCPQCGQSAEFIMLCRCTVHVTTTDLNVLDDSFQLFESAPCYCPTCQYEGPAHLFRTTEFEEINVETPFLSPPSPTLH